MEMTERHVAVDYAKILRDLSDVHCPAAERIVLVQDNLNARAPASLYAAFPAPEAPRLVEGSNGIPGRLSGSGRTGSKAARAGQGIATAARTSTE